MRILFIHPPSAPKSLAFGRFEPLGLTVLAATVPEHDVRIIDLRMDSQRYLEEQLDTWRPDLVGVSINKTIQVHTAIKLLKGIREHHPQIILIVGGHHPTMVPSDFHLTCVDYQFLGWAERSFPEFVRSLDQGKSVHHIEGLEILEHGNPIVSNPNRWDLQPEEIPLPRRDLVDKYFHKYHNDIGFRTALVNTTRGCTNRCTFCSVWKVTNGHSLVRTPEDVVTEIGNIPTHVHRVFFADDNTFISIPSAKRICDLIRDAGIHKKYSGYCRSDTIIRHPELMKEWKDIGLDNLCVGMEAVSDKELIRFNKRNEIAKNEEAARILNEIGIPFRPHFLIEPCFGRDDFNRIRNYVRDNRLNSPIFTILTPIPGSDYYKNVENEIILGYDYFDFAHAVTSTHLPPKTFYREWFSLYLKSYPLLLNLVRFIKQRYGRLTGNQRLVRENHHYYLKNLVILRFMSIFLRIRLWRHASDLEAGLLALGH